MKTPPPPPLLLFLMVESLNKNFIIHSWQLGSLKANIDKIEYYPVLLGLGINAWKISTSQRNIFVYNVGVCFCCLCWILRSCGVHLR